VASGIIIYSFFQISEIIIPDIWKKTTLDIPKQVRIPSIHPSIYLKSGSKAHRTGTIQQKR